MKLTFLGADHEVTGSCHYLCVGDKNILIDCGMEQGNDVYENQELPIPASDVDYVLLTCTHRPFGSYTASLCTWIPRESVLYRGNCAAM